MNACRSYAIYTQKIPLQPLAGILNKVIVQSKLDKLSYSDDTPVDDDDDDNVSDNNNISIPPANPTTPTADLQQQFLRSRDTHITNQPDSFVYLRDNGENANNDPRWKEFEVTLQDGNGNIKFGPDGKPMIAIAPPLSDLCGHVFLTKPDERGEVKRARVVELMKDFEGKVAKNKDLIKFKLKYDHNDLEDVMSYNGILDYVERENNNEDGHHWKFRTILGHIHTVEDSINNWVLCEVSVMYFVSRAF
jgi:hypothetical protein